MSSSQPAALRQRRKPRPEPPASVWTVRYALLAVLGSVLAAIVIGVAVSVLLTGRDLRLGVGGLLLDLALLAFLVPLHRRRPFTARALGFRAASPASAVGWVLLALIGIGLFNALWLVGVIHLRHPSTLDIERHGSTVGLVLVGLFVCLSAPVVEEVFFRGFVYRALRNRLNVALASLVAGTIFGLVHGLTFPLDTLPPRVVFGVIACLLYERTGSLWPSIALHCFIDASGFESSVTGRTGIVSSLFLLLAVVLLIYAVVRWRRRRRRPATPAGV